MKDKLQKLLDIEEIKKLKYKYFRGIDTANLILLEKLFTDNAELDYRGGEYRWQVSGKKNILEQIENAFNSDAVACHQGHHPEIDIINENEAIGLWYLGDIFIDQKRKIITRGSAIYQDIYKRIDTLWYIEKSEYDRIWEEYEPLHSNINITFSHLAEHGKKLSDNSPDPNSFLDEVSKNIKNEAKE